MNITGNDARTFPDHKHCLYEMSRYFINSKKQAEQEHNFEDLELEKPTKHLYDDF